jgi:microcystin-dependent protein
MKEPFMGEIALVAFDFAPVGWALCNGQLLAINQNAALFSLLGTTFGGDGVNNFALPNLQSRVPLHMGQGPGLSNYALGASGGVESVTLQTTQIPSHTHSYAPQATSNDGGAASPAGAIWAQSSIGDTIYQQVASDAQMAAQTLGNTGGGQPHENRQPYLTLNYVIALVGIFPPRT